jgi:hypothetical protein
LNTAIRLFGAGIVSAVLGGLLLIAVPAHAQEGFPLDGTWRSNYTAANGAHQTTVLIMQWDGTRITGTLNPGPDAMDLATAVLQPEGWKVSFSVITKDGGTIRFAGVLSDLGKYARVLSGKWTQGARSRELRFVRE